MFTFEIEMVAKRHESLIFQNKYEYSLLAKICAFWRKNLAGNKCYEALKDLNNWQGFNSWCIILRVFDRWKISLFQKYRKILLIKFGFFSEKEKSFRECAKFFFFATISLRFCISFAHEKSENFREIENAKISRKNAKKIIRKFRKKK